MTTLLRAEALYAGYGGADVLRGVSLVVQEASIVAIVGPNGAGKTTLLSAIMGLVAHRGGLQLLGASCPAPLPEALVAAGVVLVPETRALFAGMSVEENLLLGGYRRYRQGARDLPASLADVFTLFPRLRERRRQRAGTLSGGERQMLALGRALMARPRLLLLDEPSLGLAPGIARDVFRILADLRARGLSILLVEQNVRSALHLADYAYVLELGAFVLEGAAASLAGNARVIETYLGQAPAAGE